MNRVGSIVASVIAVGLCLALLAYCLPFVLSASDTGWILRSGQYILKSGSLPAVDIFSWTCRRPWVLYQWLFEVAVGFLFEAGRLWLVGAACYVLEGILLLYLLPRRWMDQGIPVWLTYLAVACILTPAFFYVRPQLASYLFILAFLSILEKARTAGQMRLLWLLPPLMVLWANSHSLWFLGLFFVLAYGLTSLRSKLVLMVFLSSSLAVLLNPYGWELVRYNIAFLTEPDFKNIGELRSVFALNEMLLYLFLAYLVAAWTVMLRHRQAVPAAGFIISGVVSVAGVLFARFCPVAAVATWPFVGLALGAIDWKTAKGTDDAQPGGFDPRVFKVVQFAVAVLVPLLLWKVRVPSDMAAAEVFMDNDVESMIFMLKHHTSDLWLNDPATGSHMILFGLGPVFIDNRFDMYGVELCRSWQDAVDGKIGWESLVQNNPRVGQAAFSRGKGLAESFLRDPRWLLVYDDGALTYWLTDTPAHRTQLQQWGLRDLKKNP